MSLKEKKWNIIDALQQVEVMRAGDPSHKSYEGSVKLKQVCSCEHCQAYEKLTKNLAEVNAAISKKKRLKRYERLKKRWMG